MSRSPITTHVLDTTLGLPAAGLEVTLEIESDGEFRNLGRGVTDSDGRIGDLLPTSHVLSSGIYRLCFRVEPYLEARGEPGFYPVVHIVFQIRDPSRHHHVPLLLSPYGYSTYRGS